MLQPVQWRGHATHQATRYTIGSLPVLLRRLLGAEDDVLQTYHFGCIQGHVGFLRFSMEDCGLVRWNSKWKLPSSHQER